jgi:hypothetical protein
MKRTYAVIIAALATALLALSLGDSAMAEGLGTSLPADLDKASAAAYQPTLTTAFGTFTFADTGLPTPFSRYLEDGLKAAMPKTARLRLFNRSVASAMDPAFREMYGDFIKNNSVDALLSGKYYSEGSQVRARLELTDLSTMVLIGTLDVVVPKSAIPAEVAVDVSPAAAAIAQSIASLDPGSGKGGLKVSASTERGAGAVYREGERMVVLITVNETAWIKVYHVDATGVVRLILPNAFSGPGARKIQAGEEVRIPGPSDAFAFEMTPPFGAEFIKVVASTQPFAKDESVGQQGFAELGTNPREAITRGMALVAPADAVKRGIALGALAKGEAKAATETAEAMASYVIIKR